MEDGKHRADEKRMNPLAFGSIARLWHLRKILPAGPAKERTVSPIETYCMRQTVFWYTKPPRAEAVVGPARGSIALRAHYLSHIQEARERGHTHFAEALTKVFERTFK